MAATSTLAPYDDKKRVFFFFFFSIFFTNISCFVDYAVQPVDTTSTMMTTSQDDNRMEKGRHDAESDA
jgi:hypothetical protein